MASWYDPRRGIQVCDSTPRTDGPACGSVVIVRGQIAAVVVTEGWAAEVDFNRVSGLRIHRQETPHGR